MFPRHPVLIHHSDLLRLHRHIRQRTHLLLAILQAVPGCLVFEFKPLLVRGAVVALQPLQGIDAVRRDEPGSSRLGDLRHGSVAEKIVFRVGHLHVLWGRPDHHPWRLPQVVLDDAFEPVLQLYRRHGIPPDIRLSVFLFWQWGVRVGVYALGGVGLVRKHVFRYGLMQQLGIYRDGVIDLRVGRVVAHVDYVYLNGGEQPATLALVRQASVRCVITTQNGTCVSFQVRSKVNGLQINL